MIVDEVHSYKLVVQLSLEEVTQIACTSISTLYFHKKKTGKINTF